MSPRAWKNAESYDLPPHAAELVKPSKHALLMLQQQQQQVQFESQEPTPRQRAALDATEPEATGPDSADATEAAPAAATDSKKPMNIRAAFGSAMAFTTPTPPQRTAEETALITGQLSGARTCQALLQGDLKPPAFGRCAANMPSELLPEWLDGFGKCVALLGETIASLHGQIEVQQKRSDKAAWGAVLGAIRGRLKTIKAELGPLREAARASAQSTQSAVLELVGSATDEFARRRGVAARWKRLAYGALRLACGRRALLLTAMRDLNALCAMTKDGCAHLSAAPTLCTIASPHHPRLPPILPSIARAHTGLIPRANCERSRTRCAGWPSCSPDVATRRRSTCRICAACLLMRATRSALRCKRSARCAASSLCSPRRTRRRVQRARSYRVRRARSS